jgi:hypothetical protein
MVKIDPKKVNRIKLKVQIIKLRVFKKKKLSESP